MLAVNVRTRRRKLRPTAGLAVANAGVSYAGARKDRMDRVALPLRGPWRLILKGVVASLGACAAKAAEARKGALLLLLHCLAPLGLLLDLLPAHEAEPTRLAGRGQGCRGGSSVRARGRIGGGNFLQHIALRLAAPCEEAQPRLAHGAAVRVRAFSFALCLKRTALSCGLRAAISCTRGAAGSEASGRGAAGLGTMGRGGALRCGGQRATTGLLGRRVVLRVLSATTQRGAQRSAGAGAGAGAIGVRRREGRQGAGRAGGAAAAAGGTGVSNGAGQAASIDGWRVGAGCVYGRCTKTPPTATAPNNHSKTCLALRLRLRREAGGGRLQPVSRALALPVPVPALTSQPLAPAAPLTAAYTRMLRGAGGRGWVVLWCREHATCTYQTQARVAALSRNKAEQSRA